MTQIHIIVGSVMGTAQHVAEQAATALTAAGHGVEINTHFRAGELPTGNEVLLICTSNTGMGDLPANIAPLLLHLTNDYPRIAGQRFAIITLGDSSYPNFAQAGHTLVAALEDLGAVALQDMLVVDAIYDDQPWDKVQPWLQSLEQSL